MNVSAGTFQKLENPKPANSHNLCETVNSATCLSKPNLKDEIASVPNPPTAVIPPNPFKLVNLPNQSKPDSEEADQSDDCVLLYYTKDDKYLDRQVITVMI